MNFEELIQQNKLKFQDTIPEKLKCLLCENVLVDPYTVPCGHNYCMSCLREHINNNSNPNCIGSDNECKDVIIDLNKNISKNDKAIEEIMQLKVHCLNTNCTEIMEIKNLEEHLETCDFKNVCCPYAIVGCNIKEINRELLKYHLKKKNIEHANIMTKYVEEINNKKEQMKNEIDRLKENMEQQLKNELVNMKVDLSNKNVMIRKLEDELKEVKEELQRCKNESHVNKNSCERNTNLISELKIDFNKETTKLNNELKKAKEELRKEMGNLKEESKVNENKLEKEIVQLQKSTQIQQKTSFEWIVEDFVTKYEAAANEDYIKSEPQYLCGYRIVLLLYPRRNVQGGECVYVRIECVPGIYDDDIYWPCTRSISLSLVTWNQDELWRTKNKGENYSWRCRDILDQGNHLINKSKIKIKVRMK